MANEPTWLREHRDDVPYSIYNNTPEEVGNPEDRFDPTLTDMAFNKHSVNDGEHVSPYDEGKILIGTSELSVELVQGINMKTFMAVLSSATRATVGLSSDSPEDSRDWEEMMKGGLQSALESQSIVFKVYGASRALTHQLVRSRNAAFHQQSQRATFYGDRPNVRMPLSISQNPRAKLAFEKAVLESWKAYRIACEEDISYQDARFALPEGTVNFIQCTYTLREFIAVYNYRACSMFMWEMVKVMRLMREAFLKVPEHAPLEKYIKISCENTGQTCSDCDGRGLFSTEWSDAADEDDEEDQIIVLHRPEPPDGTVTIQCPTCKGDGRSGRKCTFQGWESPEGQCGFPWAKERNRTFKPMFHQIGRRPGMEDKSGKAEGSPSK